MKENQCPRQQVEEKNAESCPGEDSKSGECVREMMSDEDKDVH